MSKQKPEMSESTTLNRTAAPIEPERQLTQLNRLVPGDEESVGAFVEWANDIHHWIKDLSASLLNVQDARRCNVSSSVLDSLMLGVSRSAKCLVEVCMECRFGCFKDAVNIRIGEPLVAVIGSARKHASATTEEAAIDEFVAASNWLERELRGAVHLAGLKFRAGEGNHPIKSQRETLQENAPNSIPGNPLAQPCMKPPVELSSEETAIAMAVKDNELSIAIIAKRLGVHRNTPRRWETFMKTWKMLRRIKVGNPPPRGSKNKDGTLEAKDDRD